MMHFKYSLNKIYVSGSYSTFVILLYIILSAAYYMY